MTSRTSLLAIASVVLALFGCGASSSVRPGDPKLDALAREYFSSTPQSLLETLRSMSVDDPEAEVRLVWLAEDDSCSEERQRQAIRFLASSRDETFGAAAGCLEACRSAESRRALQPALVGGNQFRRYVAATALYAQGDQSVLAPLVATLLDSPDPSGKRVFLARRLLYVDERRLVPTYIELLSDSDPHIRYIAFNELRLLARETFGYRWRVSDNREAIARWRQWYDTDVAATSWTAPDRSFELGLVGLYFSTDPTEPAMRVTNVLPDMPASRAGVQAGDILEAVDGEPVSEQLLQDLLRYEIWGPPGSTVVMQFKRPATGERRRAELRRERQSLD